MSFTCVDAFCGAGGMTLGLGQAGFESILAFDNDPNCIATQRANPKYFPRPAVLATVDEILEGPALARLALSPGELDLLAGGPPCQGFSMQRIGGDIDVRNDLVLKFIRLVEVIQPKFFVMENVRGLAGKRGREYLANVLEIAENCGYSTSMRVLDAQDFGVPQRRQRVVVVGEHLSTGGTATYRYPAPVTLGQDRITVRETIGALPPPPPDGTDHRDYVHHRSDRLSAINVRRIAALGEGQGRSHLPQELLAKCHERSAADIGHGNVYGRMRWDDVAPTITARFDSFTRGMFGHPEQLRSISLREGALLQTFPKDMNFSGNKVDIARQIGNAVPVRLAYAIGVSIAASLRKRQCGQA